MSLINKHTRITDHSATLIDNIYCNIPDLATKCDAGILQLSISDHYAVFCVSKNVVLNNKHSIFTKRIFCDKNVYNFNYRLTSESWDSVYQSSDTQIAFTRFQGVLDQYLNTVFKMQTFAMNYKNRHPWMSEALRNKIQIKNAMHTDALRTKDMNVFEDSKKN